MAVRRGSVPVAVIVVVRNGERYLGAALASIAEQTVSPHEVVVIDGGSTDATASISRAAGVCHLMQRGRGLAGARNEGIAATTAPLVAFLDHDDRWEPDKLAVQSAALNADRALAYALSTTVLELEPDALCPPHLDAAELGVPRTAGTPGALLVTRHSLEAIGGFDERLAIACDADWFTRARDAGLPNAVTTGDPGQRCSLRKRLHRTNLSNDAVTNRREMFEVARRSIARRRLA